MECIYGGLLNLWDRMINDKPIADLKSEVSKYCAITGDPHCQV